MHLPTTILHPIILVRLISSKMVSGALSLSRSILVFLWI
jgi:hypothetical protein